MYNVIIKIVNDDYTNNSSIENMINYIYRTKNCKSKQTEALPIDCLLSRQPMKV